MDQHAAADNVNWANPTGEPWQADNRQGAPTPFVSEEYYDAFTQDPAAWPQPQVQQPQQRPNQANGSSSYHPDSMPSQAYPYMAQYYQHPAQSNGHSSSQSTPQRSPPQYPQTHGQTYQAPQGNGYNGQAAMLMSPTSFQHQYPGVPYPNYLPPATAPNVQYQQQQQGSSSYTQVSNTPTPDFSSIAGPSSYNSQPPMGQSYPVYQNGTYSNVMPNGTDESWINYGAIAEEQSEEQNENEMVIDPSLTLLSDPSTAPYTPQPMPATISPQALHAHAQVIRLGPSSSADDASRSRSSDSPQAEASSKQRSAALKSKSGVTLDAAQLERLLDPQLLDSRPRETASNLISMLAGDIGAHLDIPTRIKTLQTIRDNAPGKFFEAWARKLDAVDLLKGWLQDAIGAKEKPATDVMMPLLQVIDRLPLTIESLKETKIGKLIRMLTKSPPSTAIKDMATKLEQRWLQLAQSQQTDVKREGSQGLSSESKKRPISAVDDARKKRKLAEDVSSKVLPKKATVPSKTTTKPVKATTSAQPAKVKDAKADSSFFTTTKPKPKLPSFRKISGSTEVKRDVSVPDSAEKPKIVQSNSDNPFQVALKALNKQTGIGDKSTPPVESKPDVEAVDDKKLKKRKSVSFAMGDALVKVKIIEPAVYDDDDVDAEHPHVNLRDLDRAEGLAFSHAIFDEQIDWYEPGDIEFTSEATPFDRGNGSQEKMTQETREGSVDEAFYEDPTLIPDSPKELDPPLPEIPDEPLHVLRLSPAMLQVPPEDDDEQEPPKVADLLKRISGDQVALPSSVANTSLAGIGIDPSVLANILASARSAQSSQDVPSGSVMPPGFPPPTGGEWQDPVQPWSDDGGRGRGRRGGGSGSGFRGESDQGWAGRARGGRGGRGWRGGGPGGRHEKRQRNVPCQFFQEGRCKYGDDCDFLHLGSFSQ